MVREMGDVQQQVWRVERCAGGMSVHAFALLCGGSEGFAGIALRPKVVRAAAMLMRLLICDHPSRNLGMDGHEGRNARYDAHSRFISEEIALPDPLGGLQCSIDQGGCRCTKGT